MHPDPLLRAGLEAALRRHPGFDLLADDGDDADARVSPVDVVIGDYANAVRLADASVRASDRRLASARILALTSRSGEMDIRRAIEAGVHGYLLRGGTLDELIEGVTTVANGLRYLCRSVAQRIAESMTRTSLTAREMDVLQLVVAGDSNKAIARQLRIQLGTVKSHVSAIMAKLGASSRTQAAGIAATRGLVPEHLPASGVPPATHTRRADPQVRFA
jgi:two-component system NarL family response regulator